MKFFTRKVARAFIFDTDKKLFLVPKSALPPFTYHLAGGGIGRKEESEKALRRELKEELHILSSNIRSVTFMHTQPTKVFKIPHIMDIYLVLVHNLSLKKSFEIHSVRWMTIEDMKKFLDADSLVGVEGLEKLVK